MLFPLRSEAASPDPQTPIPQEVEDLRETTREQRELFHQQLEALLPESATKSSPVVT